MGAAAVSSSTITAAVVTELGTPPSLAAVGRPEPAPGQALVRTRAAVINGIDIATNSPYFPFRMPTPMSPATRDAAWCSKASATHPARAYAFSRRSHPARGACRRSALHRKRS